MATIADRERLAQVVNEIPRLENELLQRRRILTAFYCRNLLPEGPAVVENRIRATDQRTRYLESRLRMLRRERDNLIVEAVVFGDWRR